MLETQNDYVRFHGEPLFWLISGPTLTSLPAYQSALLMAPLILFRIFASLVGFTPWLRTLLTVLIGLTKAFMAYAFSLLLPDSVILMSSSYRAYIGASRHGLVRFQLPYIGPIAERWVSEE
jgi:uncharacterized membrane protein